MTNSNFAGLQRVANTNHKYINCGGCVVVMPSVAQSIYHITENKSLTVLNKVKALTALYFEGGVGSRSLKDTARIMLAIEIVATTIVKG
jgi:hypothetical protein